MNPLHRKKIEDFINALEASLAFDEAIALAHFERTGVELGPGGEYTAADASRAGEIMALCWRDRGKETG